MPSTPGSRVVVEGRKEAAPWCGVSGRPPGGGGAVADVFLERSDSGATASSLATSSGRLSPSSLASSQSMLAIHRCRLLDWSPSAVVALAPSLDGTAVAVARESGQIELWSTAAGSVGWNCFSKIPGRKEASISSLVWCEGGSPSGRLFSAGLDGLLVEWDLCTLRQKAVVDSLGGPVWGMAVEPTNPHTTRGRKKSRAESNGICENGDGESDASDGEEGHDDDDDDDGDATCVNDEGPRVQRVAVACDDGRVRLYTVEDGTDGMTFERSLPPVTGRVLSVAWATSDKLFAGGADGCIRCWNVITKREVFRITVGIGSQKRENICVWALLWLRSGVLVSGDSTGSTQFWDGKMGTLLHCHRRHQADVLALAATPSHTSVFAAGIDGQVVIYQEISNEVQDEKSERYSEDKGDQFKNWVYVGGRRSHTHDIRALAVFVVPHSRAGIGKQGGIESARNLKRKLSMPHPVDSRSCTGATMLMSGGNDTELRIYPANAFLSFAPFSICPVPEPPVIQMVAGAMRTHPMLISQHKEWVDIWEVRGGSRMSLRELVENRARSVTASPGSVADDRSDMDNVGSDRDIGREALVVSSGNGVVREDGANDGIDGKIGYGGEAGDQRIRANGIPPRLVARIKSRGSDHIVCSSLSPDGRHVAFSDRVKVRLFRLEKRASQGGMEAPMVIMKRRLPVTLLPAQKIVFSADSSRLVLATAGGSILVVDVNQPSLLQKLSQSQFAADHGDERSPVCLLSTSQDGQWIAAVNASGRVNVYNLETLRHHWSTTSPDGSLVTALVFHPGSGALILATAMNKIHVLDVEARCLANWSRMNGKKLPRRLLEMPGCITGLSVPPNAHSAAVIAYTSKHMCVIDLSKPLQEKGEIVKEQNSAPTAGRPDAGYAGNGAPPVAENKNFAVVRLNHRCLFLGHLTEDSVFLLEKPWVDVMAKFPAPLYRHTYGT
ncbi:hypothetical protein CBR_g57871 [Chara braunii]|uniref:Uncharacterized protein n=1 Tax=Chara braunii TaxID=69332 RepID=A0A388K8L0_CHABU|nr:hypothetical protein CBR_g57871 [Chara braunii]|eukprot:GBG66273.1 hypothetical protein CBR_g57871 [Chara braunii]